MVSDQRAANGTNALAPTVFPVVWVVPLSTATTGRTAFDIRLEAGDGNVPRTCWARIPALQLIDKIFLKEYQGQTRQETLDAVTAQILRFLGILAEPD